MIRLFVIIMMQMMKQKTKIMEMMNGMNMNMLTNSTIYSCPMHPEVNSDKPGKCPKCGMELVQTN
jgi:Cu(I)/Ag(I) efflux system membrane fusion protein